MQHDLAAGMVDPCGDGRSLGPQDRGTETNCWGREAPVDNDLAGMACLLVNPRVPLSTGPVFKAWDGQDRGPLPTGDVRTITLTGRNDLEPPALALCPVIGDVLAALRATVPLIARMSGSGATCFALYDDPGAAQAAAAQIARSQPGWWQLLGKLR